MRAAWTASRTATPTPASRSPRPTSLIYAHHQPDLSIVESEWRGSRSFSIEIQIWTLGPATLIRDGQRLDGYWMRWEEDSMLTFWADEDAAQPLALKPGNTWFQVVPLDFEGVTFE